MITKLEHRIVISGRVTIFTSKYDEMVLCPESMGIISVHTIPNMIVNGGIALYAGGLNPNNTTLLPGWLAAGTGTTAITATDTTLENEQDRNAIALTTDSNGVLTYKGFFGKNELNGLGSNITNYALFNASSGVTMFAAVVDSPGESKDSSKSITVSWAITLANA